MKHNKKPSKINIKVIVYSIIAFGFLALTFFVNWIFIIGAAVMVYLNQRELMRRRK
jgi:hypothetical protein